MEGDTVSGKMGVTLNHFNPLPPHGGRQKAAVQLETTFPFQSTPSAWRETQPSCWQIIRRLFQSTPSAWRETLSPPYYITIIRISIHSLRMEGDIFLHGFRFRILHFNPLPPHGGRRSLFRRTVGKAVISIHSLRMEGDVCRVRFIRQHRISIHSLRMEGDLFGSHDRVIPHRISIHSLRMEGDMCNGYDIPMLYHFNPLPPHGGRPVPVDSAGNLKIISIHSLRMEGDSMHRWLSDTRSYFNPLPPHGGRLSSCTAFPS